MTTKMEKKMIYIRNQECPIAEKRIAKMKELGGEKT